MVNDTQQTVVDKNGVRGTVTRIDRPASGAAQLLVEFEHSDEQIIVPANMLVLRDDNTYYLPIPIAELQAETTAEVGRRHQVAVIPVIEEEVVLEKRLVEKGRVRLTKRVRELEEVVDEPLLEEEVEIERVPVNRIVEGPVAVRYEGDTMIVPLLHEVLLVRKRLVLREEVRITKKRSEVQESQRVSVRREEVEIERINGTAESEPN
jgi:uncharacterized protein (TIGR02271 family)